MSMIDPQEFGELRAEVRMLRATVDKMDSKMDDITERLSEAKGGWKVLMGLGGASSVVGGAITWVATHFLGKGGPS